VLTLLPVLVATAVGPVPPLAPSLVGYDLATLTDAEARHLAGRRAPYRVVIEGRPDWSAEDGWRYDCRGEGPAYRSLWVRDGDDLAAVPAEQGSGLLLVEATLRRIVHRPVTGADGSLVPGLVAYRLSEGAGGAPAVGRPLAPAPCGGRRDLRGISTH
jgi:hypothetical protein